MNDGLITNKYLFRPFYFQNVFSPEECQQIIDYPDTTSVVSYTGSGIYDPKSNTIKTKFFRESTNVDWITQKLMKYILPVNQKYYRFKIAKISDLQLMKYQENSFFGWHIDLNGHDYFVTRKISIVIFLSDPNDYEGGQLIFGISENSEIPDIKMEQGSIIIFPSYQIHMVTPVTAGTRHTLVAWIHGSSFE
jgi:PKHD-type hydroxylase